MQDSPAECQQSGKQKQKQKLSRSEAAIIIYRSIKGAPSLYSPISALCNAASPGPYYLNSNPQQPQVRNGRESERFSTLPVSSMGPAPRKDPQGTVLRLDLFRTQKHSLSAPRNARELQYTSDGNLPY